MQKFMKCKYAEMHEKINELKFWGKKDDKKK